MISVIVNASHQGSHLSQYSSICARPQIMLYKQLQPSMVRLHIDEIAPRLLARGSHDCAIKISMNRGPRLLDISSYFCFSRKI